MWLVLCSIKAFWQQCENEQMEMIGLGVKVEGGIAMVWDEKRK